MQPSTLVRFAQQFGFDGFSSLQKVFRDLRGLGRISETNISESLREVRLALLGVLVILPWLWALPRLHTMPLQDRKSVV